MHISWLHRLLVAFVAAVGMAGAAQAKDLLVLADDIPAGLDYDGPTASLIPTYGGIANLLEPLVYYAPGEVNEEGVQLLDFNKFEGRLAESWTYDPETFTWTFTLRQGVKGCNGATFNADDVVYTFARAKSVSGAAPIGWFLSNVGSIAGFTPAVFAQDESGAAARTLGDEVEKIDDYTVQIRQSGPNQLFLRVLTIFGLYIYDKETMEANATEEDPWSHTYNNNVNAPGFGPWCLDSWDKGAGFNVVANADYYRGAPAYDRVVLRKVPQSANRVAILQSGRAQIAERLTPKEYDRLSGMDGVKVVSTYGNENLFLYVNYQVPPYDNVAMRKALAHAVPYDKIIATSYFGKARKWPGMIPTTYPGYHEASVQYAEDPEKARAYLAEAGYPEGQGLEAFPDALRITYIAEKESALGPTATVLQTALRDVGIPMELDPIPQTQYGERELVKKDMPLGLTDHVKPIGVDAAYGILLSYVTAAKGGIMNAMNYSNEAVDNALFSTLNEADDAKRAATLVDIQETLMEELAMVPILEYKTHWATSADVTGVVWHPDNALHYYDFRPAE